jgi:hypothetical protein
MVLNASALSSQISAIETLIGNNYVRLKRDVEIAQLLALDSTLEKWPPKPTAEGASLQKTEYEK